MKEKFPTTKKKTPSQIPRVKQDFLDNVDLQRILNYAYYAYVYQLELNATLQKEKPITVI